MIGLLATLRSRLLLRLRARVGPGARVAGRVWVHGGGAIRIGARVALDGATAPIELHAAPGAELVLGDDVAVAGGTSIEACRSVRLGDRVTVGGFCKILDNHFHPLTGNRHRGAPPSAPVEIADDARVGWRVIVLPGASIPRGADVRPATVVRAQPAAARGRARASAEGP